MYRSPPTTRRADARRNPTGPTLGPTHTILWTMTSDSVSRVGRHTMNRRQLLKVLGVGAAAAASLPLLEACAPTAPAAKPTDAPAKPAEAAKPADASKPAAP